MAIGYVMLYANSNILCSICTKLHMFDKCAGLNTSTCQYPVIVIAPPAGSRKFGRYKWLWHIPPVFITWNAYCSPFIDFLKPPLAVSPGARARSLLLAALIRARAPMVWGPYWICSFIIIIIILRNESHFWGPKHARKVMKLCTRIRTGENLHLICFKSGCGKMARQRHLYTFNGVCLELHFTYKYKSRYTHVT